MRRNLFGTDPVRSVSYSNHDTIKSIMELFEIERFDLDCTYSIGHFWDKLPQPLKKTDLFPQRKGVIKSNSIDLPFDDSSMKSIMFDPPFVIAGKNYKDVKDGSSIIAKRFEGYENFNELKKHYYGTLLESFRLLESDGYLVLKCQDVVSSGKNHFTHCMVMQMALQIGFYPKDLFILLAKNRLNSFNGNKWKNQYHARKYHSYFWVFQKKENKVNYKFCT